MVGLVECSILKFNENVILQYLDIIRCGRKWDLHWTVRESTLQSIGTGCGLGGIGSGIGVGFGIGIGSGL